MRGSRAKVLIAIGLVAVLSREGLAQTETGGWQVQGVTHRRGAERGDHAINVTLAILGDGTYIASTFLACDRAFSCEWGTWGRAKRGRLLLKPTFPIEFGPPHELSLARCLYNNSFLTTRTNKPRVKKYRHVATLGSDGRLSIRTTANVSARFMYGRTAVRAT